MRIKEAIGQADTLRPNTIDEETKAKWLFGLEVEIAEMMNTELQEFHFPEEDNELLLPFPKDEAYVLYLCAKIDNAQEETELYANDMVIFNESLKEARQWWWRTHPPREVKYVRGL